MMHDGFGQYGSWFCGPGAFFSGPLGWVITLLFWGLIIALVVKLFSALLGGWKRKEDPAENLQIIRDRYARGEITEEEYGRMKTELG